MSDTEDRCVALMDERIQSLKRIMDERAAHFDEKLAMTEKALDLARQVWPTQKDVAQQLERLKGDGIEAARREAAILFDKADIKIEELNKQIIVSQKMISENLGVAIGRQTTMVFIFSALGGLGVLVGVIATAVALWPK